MTSNDLRNDESEKPSSDQPGAPVSSSINGSRRRFTSAGIAASGVLLTLTSRSVLADVTGFTTKSPSGFVSGNQSSYGPAAVSLGRTPGYWKNHTDEWPIPTDTLFKDVFSCKTGAAYANVTLLDILSAKTDVDPYNICAHLTAALLNARKNWTPFLTEERVKTMFAEWQSRGYFNPSATVSWSGSQIVDYLKATMPL